MADKIAKMPKTVIKKLVKENSENMRITKTGLLKLQDVITDFARMTVIDCVRTTQHSKRKTINESDVVFATT